MLFRLLYVTLKEGDAIYKQQYVVIFKFEHLQLQTLSIILDDTTFLCQFHEFFKNDFLAIGIQGQLKNHHQV